VTALRWLARAGAGRRVLRGRQIGLRYATIGLYLAVWPPTASPWRRWRCSAGFGRPSCSALSGECDDEHSAPRRDRHCCGTRPKRYSRPISSEAGRPAPALDDSSGTHARRRRARSGCGAPSVSRPCGWPMRAGGRVWSALSLWWAGDYLGALCGPVFFTWFTWLTRPVRPRAHRPAYGARAVMLVACSARTMAISGPLAGVAPRAGPVSLSAVSFVIGAALPVGPRGPRSSP